MTPTQAERVVVALRDWLEDVDREAFRIALVSALTTEPAPDSEAVRLLRLVHSARVPIPVGLAQEIMVFLSYLDHPKGGA